MNAKTTKLLAAVLGAGALGCGLRLVLYRFGFDEKHILSDTHPLHLMTLALTGLMAVYLALSVRHLVGSNDPEANFPRHPLREWGMLAAGCLFALYGVSLARDVNTPLAVIRTVMALGAAFSMVLCALRRVHSFCRGLISAFFALDMLCRYQTWSGNPQLADYTFQILACVLLALTSYHRLAFDVGLGKRRMLLWCSLMGSYLCLICAAGPETRVFYLGGALWAGACMCTAEAPVEENEEETL